MRGEQQFVRGIEEVHMSIDGTVDNCEKYGSVLRVVDGEVGREAGTTARFFNDVRKRINWQQMNPPETDTGWFAGMIESLLTDQMRRKNVDDLSCRVL